MINHLAILPSDLVHWSAVVINNAFQILVSILLLLYEATACWWRFPTLYFIVLCSCIKSLNRNRLPLYSSLLTASQIQLVWVHSGLVNAVATSFYEWIVVDVCFVEILGKHRTWDRYCNTLLITTADQSLRNMDKLSIISYVNSCLNIVTHSFSLFCIFLFLSLV